LKIRAMKLQKSGRKESKSPGKFDDLIEKFYK
jgi:hypothetical protein